MKFVSKAFFVALIIAMPIFSYVHAETTDEREARLRAELAQVEKEQAETEKVLIQQQNQSASIQRDILILTTKIKAAQLNIKAKNLLIESLGKDIGKKQDKIEDLEGHIARGKETLAQIMRKTNEVDSYTFAEFLLSQSTLSDAFLDIDNFESVQVSLKTTFEDIRDDKAQTESEKSALNTRKNQEIDARAVIQAEQKSIEANEKEKQRLLAISKTSEITYGQELAAKRAKAAQIRAALFSLRDATAIPFEVALRYANEASKATGIRPAFILGVFAQESSLGADATFGKQVGSCYLTDPKTGSGASVKSGNIFPNVMKPTRDVEPFLSITKALGLDYTKTLVSCPQAIGWGGAMGPAQFIPSTWVLYESGIRRSLGGSITPNPWNPEHAFIAASLLLIDNGAVAGSFTSEKNAACKYYSGSSCAASSYANTYGASVMTKADMIQRTMIDPLQGI